MRDLIHSLLWFEVPGKDADLSSAYRVARHELDKWEEPGRLARLDRIGNGSLKELLRSAPATIADGLVSDGLIGCLYESLPESSSELSGRPSREVFRGILEDMARERLSKGIRRLRCSN